MPPATASIDRFAPVSERMRKMPRRTSGAFDRRSMNTNAVRRAADASARLMVCAESQPFSCVRTIV